MSANPFLDSARVHGDLYADATRIAQRTGALARAKTVGQHPADVIAELAATGPTGPTGPVLDIGCGRGSTTVALAEQLRPARLIAFDASTALLAHARARLTHHAGVQFLRGDFHAIALPEACITLAVAAFCLYHSPRPNAVAREIARCLVPGGLSITVTKSQDSYRALDEVITASGLDNGANQRSSLYETFHSDNHAEIISSALDVRQVIHHEHHFQFADADHIAAYALTNPKYRLHHDPTHVAHRLRATIGDRPLEMTSSISYVLARTR